MSADGDIVREALIPGTSLTVGDQVLAALARLEAAVAQRDALAEALRRIEQLSERPYWDDPSAGVGPIARAALAEAGLE